MQRPNILSSFLLATLLTRASSSSSSSKTTGPITMIHFDDLPTPLQNHTLGPLPSSSSSPSSPNHHPYNHSYHHLRFSAYNVFNPALSTRLPDVDRRVCATSWPNALVGSGANPYPQYRDKGAYFYVGEGDGDGEVGGNMGEGGNGDGEEVVSFELVGFNIKPIAVPPGADVRVVVRGYPYPTSTNTNNNKNNDKAHPHQATAAAAKKEEILQWTVTFPEGFDEMFEVRIREFSGEVWTGLRGVEVRALYGVQELDWEFCLDDLVVVFEGVGAGAVGGVGREGMGKEGEEGEGERERGQVVLRGES